MEVITEVDKENFRTGLPTFQCPIGTWTGSGLCLAVTSRQGEILTILYSVILTLLFAVCWKLASMAVMLLSHALDSSMRGSPESTTSGKYRRIVRDTGLVGFWNAREPFEASFFMLGYLSHLRGAPRGHPHIRRPGIMLLLLAVMWLLATYSVSILVAAQLIAGRFAPANPNVVFVPMPGQTAAADLMRLQALRAPATLRSLGSTVAASSRHGIGKSFSLISHLRSGDSPWHFTYQYTVNSHDMGLQKWHDLKQEVSGRCDVDTSWFWKNVPEDDMDLYRPWGLANKTVNVVYDGERKNAPRATAIPFPYANPDFLVHHAAEHRYGVIVHSSHRVSYTPGTDPWYETEAFPPPDDDTGAQIADPPGNRVKGGRPALSCTQKDTWSYNGTMFKNIYELTDKANIDFPDAWAIQLQLDFGLPRVIDMINSAGPSSLVSSTTSVAGRFDAESSSIEKDMTRLLAATWVSSADTFRNMLMVSNPQNIPNAARDSDGRPQDGVDLFVVSTPRAVTLRFSVLVTIPTLLVFFTLVLSFLAYWARGKTWYKKILFAEGAYQFAHGQDPSILVESMRLSGVMEECVRKIHTSSASEAVTRQQNGGVFTSQGDNTTAIIPLR